MIMETSIFSSVKSNSLESSATIDNMNKQTSTIIPTPSLQHYNSLLNSTYLNYYNYYFILYAGSFQTAPHTFPPVILLVTLPLSVLLLIILCFIICLICIVICMKHEFTDQGISPSLLNLMTIVL